MIRGDIHVHDMMEIMSFLEPKPPVTTALDRWSIRDHTQKDHMMWWMYDQPTASKGGAYSRRKGNESTRTAYNRFLNPGGLLWMAEALGERKERLIEALKAAIDAEKTNYRLRCIAFRKIIPFERILELLNHPESWRYDKRVKPLLDFDEEGQPFISDGKEERYMDIVESECPGLIGK